MTRTGDLLLLPLGPATVHRILLDAVEHPAHARGRAWLVSRRLVS